MAQAPLLAMAAYLPPTIVLGLLVLGLGGAAQWAAGRQLPFGVLPAAGLGGLVVISQFARLLHVPALAAGIVAALLAIAGLVQLGGRLRRGSLWAAGAAGFVYLVYVGTIGLSGQATFGGYGQLADTAIHLLGGALLPGGAPDGISGAPGAIWRNYYETSYPTGGAATLGVVSALSFTSPLQTIQPLMAMAMATITASAWVLLEPFMPSRPARAVAGAATALPALTLGFAMQGSLKEVLATALLVGTCAALPEPLEGDAPPTWRASARAALPAAFALAGVVAAIGGAAAVYVVPIAVLVVIPWLRFAGLRPTALMVVSLGAITAALSLPTIIGLRAYLQLSGAVMTMQNEVGNLLRTVLPKNELSGIWLGGDFRLPPTTHESLSNTLAVIALGLAIFGLVAALVVWVRRPTARVAAATAWLAGGGLSVIAVVHVGSPWADWKGYAVFGPTAVAATAVGIGTLGRSRWLRIPAVAVGAVLAGAIVTGAGLVAWSAHPAPETRFAELEHIDHRFAGRGPAFATEFEEFDRALLHRTNATFALDAFDAIPLYNRGGPLDVEDLSVEEFAKFRLLIVRRGPLTSRPPGNYVLRQRGRYYEVWQRDPAIPAARLRLPLGADGNGGSGARECWRVRELAALARPGEALRVATGGWNQRVSATGFAPAGWARVGDGSVKATGAGTARTTVHTAPNALVSLWFEGHDPRLLTVHAGGKTETTPDPNIQTSPGTMAPLLTARADAQGELPVTITRPGRRLRSGWNNVGATWTALWASDGTGPEGERISTVDPKDARAVSALCGRPHDWIELAKR